MSYGAKPTDGYGNYGTTSDERTWAMLAHLSPLVLGFLGPLIIWLVKKEESAFVADQAKEALNFSLTIMIMSLLLLVTCFGPAILGIYALVMHIMAGIEANKGTRYRYSFNWQLIS